MYCKKRLSFDTSAVNALADDADSLPLLAGIRTGYFTRLTCPSIEEPLATPDTARRAVLFRTLRKLLINGECVQTHDFITSTLIRNYEEYGTSKWASMDIRFKACEDGIARDDFLNAHGDNVRAFNLEAEKEFERLFLDERPNFERLFLDAAWRPANTRELLDLLLNGQGDGEAFSITGAQLYKRTAGYLPTKDKLRAFVLDCPPFLAVMLATLQAHYEWTIRERPVSIHKRVNRMDLFAAIYLPYCDVYVTRDVEQMGCLTEVASLAGLSTDVIHYHEFRAKLDPFAPLQLSA